MGEADRRLSQAGGRVTGQKATAVGFGAVMLWACLALFTVGAGGVPPLQLSAMCFAIGGIIGLVWTIVAGCGLAVLRGQRPAVWGVGIAGLFGYHVCYFTALSLAPAAPASLVAFLWPLLIVPFSGLLPGERLRPGHVLGAVVAFVGAGLVVGGSDAGFAAEQIPGYLAALCCALIWSGYSILSRRLGAAPTETVAVFCLATSLLSFLAHLVFEPTVWPDGAGQWLAVVGLGLGPVGLAFYLWDIGVKHGNIQMLGVASYAAPLLSTLLLIATGHAKAGVALLVAAGLVAGGALIAARAGRSSRNGQKSTG